MQCVNTMHLRWIAYGAMLAKLKKKFLVKLLSKKNLTSLQACHSHKLLISMLLHRNRLNHKLLTSIKSSHLLVFRRNSKRVQLQAHIISEALDRNKYSSKKASSLVMMTLVSQLIRFPKLEVDQSYL